jgi:very-short-patch-repair endonuclease
MSSWEDYFERQMEDVGLPKAVREYKFLKDRKFRFDFAFTDIKFAVEIDGGVLYKSRHTSPKGFTADLEKFNLATLDGWDVIRATSGQVSSGQAIEWVKTYFERYVK